MKHKINHKIIRLKEVNSTNRFLRDNINVLETRTAVVAEHQTEGRGRRGKNWDNDGTMLMFSILEKNALYPQSSGTAAAVSVIKALEKLYGINAYVKWPNDIITGNLKVCGILCESVIQCDSNGKNIYNNQKTDVICGIGININTEKEFFAKNQLDYAGSLKMICGIDADFDVLLDGILSEFFTLLDCPFSEYKTFYTEKCVTLNKDILITGADGTASAKSIGITDEGFLICKNASGETFTVNSGEVSVRGLYGYV